MFSFTVKPLPYITSTHSVTMMSYYKIDLARNGDRQGVGYILTQRNTCWSIKYTYDNNTCYYHRSYSKLMQRRLNYRIDSPRNGDRSNKLIDRLYTFWCKENL